MSSTSTPTELASSSSRPRLVAKSDTGDRTPASKRLQLTQSLSQRIGDGLAMLARPQQRAGDGSERALRPCHTDDAKESTSFPADRKKRATISLHPHENHR